MKLVRMCTFIAPFISTYTVYSIIMLYKHCCLVMTILVVGVQRGECYHMERITHVLYAKYFVLLSMNHTSVSGTGRILFWGGKSN